MEFEAILKMEGLTITRVKIHSSILLSHVTSALGAYLSSCTRTHQNTGRQSYRTFLFFFFCTQLLSIDCETPKRLKKKRHVGLSQGPLAMACRMDLA